ncbi:MAG: peptidoglycan DD-metalloendopeptidase family protein [Candidatus Aenigmarchaeota archaeon]|nr:peptidoglycan DD-metalloendopeptidase family protein [Candidatus Aenigmarchaeota archaeon]
MASEEDRISKEIESLRRMGERGRAASEFNEEERNMLQRVRDGTVKPSTLNSWVDMKIHTSPPQMTGSHAQYFRRLAGNMEKRGLGNRQAQVLQGSPELALPPGGQEGGPGDKKRFRVRIASPKDDSQVDEGKKIDFAAVTINGTAPMRFFWHSDKVGYFYNETIRGTRSLFSTDQLPAGEHMITVSVQDVRGRTANDKIKIRVGKALGPIGGQMRRGGFEPIGRGAQERGAFGKEQYMKTMMPAVRSAIMWGRKQMGIAARRKADSIIYQHRDELRELTRNYRNMTRNYRRLLNILNRHVRDLERGNQTNLAARFTGRGRRGADLQTLLGFFGETMPSGNQQNDIRAVQTLMNNIQQRTRDTENEFWSKLAATDIYNELKTYLDAQADKIASEAAWRYKLQWTGRPYGTTHVENAPATATGIRENVLLPEMKAEAAMLTDFWTRNARSTLRRMGGSFALGMRALSMQSMRFGDIWRLIVDNFWQFLTGPWILGSAIVIAQYMFMAWWSPFPPTPLVLIGAPLLGGLLLFLVNFAAAKYPMEWLSHLISGIIIGYTVIIFLSALGFPPIGNAGFYWWLAFAILGGIGAFQFYSTGGFNAIVPLAVIVMIFGYASLGPYSGQVREVRDQVMTPLKFVWLNLKNTFSGIWLLVTNPTEWYARQQLQNVRPENPMDFPKGVEINRLDAVPDSVPSGQKFILFAVLENKGDQDAKNIEISSTCGGVAGYYEIEQEQQTGLSIGSLSTKTESATSPHCTEGTIEPTHVDRLRPGEGQSVRLEFTGQGRIQESRAAEVVFAKPVLHVKYTLSTNSSLTVEIAKQEEIRRRQMEKAGEKYYYNEIARSKVGPAQFSLNVGPQPLEEGKPVVIAASISNTRFDGSVILPVGAKIIITVPDILNENKDLRCEPVRKGKDGSIAASCNGGTCTMLQEWEIRSGEFSELFPLYCTFTVSKLPEDRASLTSAIIGELIEYKFLKLEEKSVKVTPSGIKRIGDATKCAADVESKWSTYTSKESIIKNAVNEEFIIDGETKTLAGLMQNEDNAKMLVASQIWKVSGSGGKCSLLGGSITRDEIINYVESNAPTDSIFKGKGGEIYDSAVSAGVNPAFMLALAIHEGAWGTSPVSKCKLNPFGYGATNSCSDQCADVSGCAKRYSTVEDAIKDVAKNVYERWVGPSPKLPPQRTTLAEMSGSTATGSVYATDNNWPNAMASWMSKITGESCSATSAGASSQTSTQTSLIGVIWKLDQKDIDDANCGSGIGTTNQIATDETINIKCGVKILAKKITDGASYTSDTSYVNWKDCLNRKNMAGSLVVGNFAWPLDAKFNTITSCFGDPRDNGPHGGLDIDTGTGDDVKPIAAGYVLKTDSDPNGYGNYVQVVHGNNFVSQYNHLSSITVSKNQQVSTNTVIGQTGSTGNVIGDPGDHLDLMVWAGENWKVPLTGTETAAVSLDLSKSKAKNPLCLYSEEQIQALKGKTCSKDDCSWLAG